MKNTLTLDEISNIIIKEEYVEIGKSFVVYCATLHNGLPVIGMSESVEPKNFDYEACKESAKKGAIEKIRELDEYYLQLNPNNSKSK